MKKTTVKKLIIFTIKIIAAPLLTLVFNLQFSGHTSPSEKVNFPVCSGQTSNKCQESKVCNSDRKLLEALEDKPEDLIHVDSEEAITQID